MDKQCCWSKTNKTNQDENSPQYLKKLCAFGCYNKTYAKLQKQAKAARHIAPQTKTRPSRHAFSRQDPVTVSCAYNS